MHRYEAVLFDWMLTLAHYPDDRELLEIAHERLGREIASADVDAAVQLLGQAGHDEAVVALTGKADCSYEQHRRATMLLFDRAQIDAELADTMYALLCDPSSFPVYDESAAVLGALADQGVRVAVVSDIHIDLRAYATRCGIGEFVDEWVLSFEHGVQKPDPAIFRLALDGLGVEPSAALMVGDRPSHDGAAASIGIDTLILPVRSATTAVRSPRLDVVLQIVGETSPH